MIPAVIGALGVGLGAYHSVGELMDNKRYWDDYRKNTGVSNRYYWRSGAGDWAKYGSRALVSASVIGRYGSMKTGVRRNSFRYSSHRKFYRRW